MPTSQEQEEVISRPFLIAFVLISLTALAKELGDDSDEDDEDAGSSFLPEDSFSVSTSLLIPY